LQSEKDIQIPRQAAGPARKISHFTTDIPNKINKISDPERIGSMGLLRASSDGQR